MQRCTRTDGIAGSRVAAIGRPIWTRSERLEDLGGGRSICYYLKAMNCPHHHRIFAAEPRSYRDLPLRLAEYGTCYRYEQSGELFGLMRVRSLNMNDAHIYCTPEQFARRVQRRQRDVSEVFQDLRHREIRRCASARTIPRKTRARNSSMNPSCGSRPRTWCGEVSEEVRDQLRRGAERSGVLRTEDRRAGLERDRARIHPRRPTRWISPCPKRFGLVYKDRDNTEKTPLCIHRAPLGTHERFIGFLIEHYAGNFPLWLAPEQVRVLTIGDDDPLLTYAKDRAANSAPTWSARKAITATTDQSQDRRRGNRESPYDARHWRPRHGGG